MRQFLKAAEMPQRHHNHNISLSFSGELNMEALSNMSSLLEDYVVTDLSAGELDMPMLEAYQVLAHIINHLNC